MERKTFTISFLIRRNKLTRNLEAPVIMRITVNGERTEVAIQRSISPDEWNSQKGCAKSRTKYGKVLNEYLDQIRLQVYQCQQDIRLRGRLSRLHLLRRLF